MWDPFTPKSVVAPTSSQGFFQVFLSGTYTTLGTKQSGTIKVTANIAQNDATIISQVDQSVINVPAAGMKFDFEFDTTKDQIGHSLGIVAGIESRLSATDNNDGGQQFGIDGNIAYLDIQTKVSIAGTQYSFCKKKHV